MALDREEKIQELMAFFYPLFLKPYMRSNLESCFRNVYFSSKSERRIPYNFKVIGDEEQQKRFQQIFEAAWKSICSDANVYRVREEEMLKKDATLLPTAENSVLFITDCKNEELSATDKSAWEEVIKWIEQNPQVVCILCADQNIMEKRFHGYEHLYYRIFSCTIVPGNATVQDILAMLYRNLSHRGLQITDDFAEGIQHYVETVYPKADLKNEDFAEDLENRIMREYYKTPNTRELTSRCIPFYVHEQNEVHLHKEKMSDGVEKPGQEKKNNSEILIIPSSDEVLSHRIPAESKKNILILSLSSFNRNPLMQSSCVFDGITYKYYYQMEPVPQAIRKILQKKNEKIDEIIMIVTKEVLTPVEGQQLLVPEKTVKEGKKSRIIPEHTVTLQNEEGGGVSALDYFIDSFEKQLHGQPMPEFKTFPYDPDENEQIAGEKTICKVVSEIRTVKRPTVYVDTHGGLRTTQEILNGVLSLLQLEGIHIASEHVFATEYNPKTKQSVIRNAGSVMDILDFVSGMNELINYARTDSLSRVSFKDELQQSILSDAKKIAEGIQLCNIEGFEAGLDALNEDLKQYKGSDPGSLFDLFINNISDNYRKILNPEKRNVKEEINWCVKKGFYQQALTLIESKIPEYLASERCFRMSGDDLQQVRNKCKITGYEINNYVFNRTTGFLLKSRPGDLSMMNPGTNVEKNVYPSREVRRSNHEFCGSRIDIQGDTAKKFLALHWSLKSLRNNADHVYGDLITQISLENLKRAIQRYSSFLERMVSYPDTNNISVQISYKKNE